MSSSAHRNICCSSAFARNARAFTALLWQHCRIAVPCVPEAMQRPPRGDEEEWGELQLVGTYHSRTLDQDLPSARWIKATGFDLPAAIDLMALCQRIFPQTELALRGSRV